MDSEDRKKMVGIFCLCSDLHMEIWETTLRSVYVELKIDQIYYFAWLCHLSIISMTVMPSDQMSTWKVLLKILKMMCTVKKSFNK